MNRIWGRFSRGAARWAAGMIAMLVMQGGVNAQFLLNVDFRGTSDGQGPISIKTGSAAIGLTSADVWNASRNLVQNGFVENLVLSDGTPTTIGINVTNAPGAWSSGLADEMYDKYVYPFGSGDIEIGVTNLPAGAYDIYLYGHAGPNVDQGNSLFSVLVGDADYGSQATTTGPGWSSPIWEEGQQYVLFRSVFIQSNADVLQINVAPDAYSHASINGLQIIDSNSEPVAIIPGSQVFSDVLEVRIQKGAGAGTVYYTLDGGDPTETSTEYTGPFQITETTEIRARLYVNGFPASEIVSETYTKVELPDIQIVPPGGLFTNAVFVTMVNNVAAGTVIRYTVDGSEPTASSTIYGGGVELTAAATVRARVFFNGFPVSDEFSETYSRVYAFEDDGVPFEWRQIYFGPWFLTDPAAAADADVDNDFYTTLEEYEQGTDPTDGASFPQIVMTIRAVPKLTFNAVIGKTYRVLWKESASDPDWQVLGDPILATESSVSVVDPDAPETAVYQIELVTPDSP